MTELPPPVRALVTELNRLPGIGPRSAERLALFLVQENSGLCKSLAASILEAGERTQLCENCGALTETQPCPICTATDRDPGVLCVVERAMDILSLEKSRAFRGRYQVLGGRISPLNGIGPEDLRMAHLEARLNQEAIQEIILALGSDVESDATCHYISQRFAGRGLRITRLAQGLPAGSGLEYADELTLARALEGRQIQR